MGAKLLIFNPEHDLALAVGNKSYTPPAIIDKLKKDFSLLPAAYAGDGDFVLVPQALCKAVKSKLPDLVSPLFPLRINKKAVIISLSQLPIVADKISMVIPWGWNHHLRKNLIAAGVSPNILPSETILETLRRLSHRRTTISFFDYFKNYPQYSDLPSPKEIHSLNEAEEFLSHAEVAFFKAPWSSSGRGIVVSDHITRKGLMEWAHGILSKQGSIIAEKAWDKKIDFASEWWMGNGKAEFVGLSYFKASSRGKYHGNTLETQCFIREAIIKNTDKFDASLLRMQREALETKVGRAYSGPLGIDMLADTSGHINPCVEINFRLTMGFIATKRGREILQNLPEQNKDILKLPKR